MVLSYDARGRGGGLIGAASTAFRCVAAPRVQRSVAVAVAATAFCRALAAARMD